MADERQKLHPLAVNAVEELRAKGVDPCVDDVVWLHELARECMAPCGQIHPGMTGAPVRVGNVTLWPFTIGSADWFISVACPLVSGEWQTYALAYALANARDTSALELLTDYATIKGTLRKFKRGLNIRLRELTSAIDAVMSVEPRPVTNSKRGLVNGDPQEKPRDPYAGLVATLCSTLGQSPDYWRWGIGRSEAMDLLRAYNEAHTVKGKRIDAGDPAVRALWNFRQAINVIIEENRSRG